MQKDVFKITSMNSDLKMKITELLSENELLSRWWKGGDLFVLFGSHGEVLGAVCSSDFEKRCLIHFLAVAGSDREKGIGSSLVNRVLAYYSERCKEIFVFSNGEADSFFMKFGFERIGIDNIDSELAQRGIPKGFAIDQLTPMRLELSGKWS